MYGSSYRSRRSSGKKRFGLGVFFILFWVVIILLLRAGRSETIISPIADDFVPPTHAPLFRFFSPKKDPEKLRTLVQNLVGNKWKNYSVYVVDFTSGFVMGINESSIFDAASINKIPILAALYREAGASNINFSDTITMQQKDIQDYGTGSMRYDEPGTVYSIKTLANLMIKKSDNTAAYVLANYVLKLKDIQSYIETLGTTQTDMVKNTTSNKDVALLFRKMLNGEVASQALTQEMIGLLKDTDFEDRLPAKLPGGVTVYHKIGTGLAGAVHDAGIVENGSIKYYIGVFTGNTTDEERTSEEIAEVSLAVYEFMSR